ncbi:TPA: tRNA (N6-threonylcarbamoyladenosine(37)-N6)-methyltransferase TrmO [Candidatus Sumerlaeota bacterium]|jgi:tRNA (adenine37-N6)-methyltransferase|nr:tRNA (N6-threonylcarbamoyladenosine(37)-N6)-methyltransferase TrmO [Candidatus Sumerlaeota bacterium]
MNLQPIGVVYTPFHEATGTPLQPVYSRGYDGTLEIFDPFVPGLKDLDGFDRIWLLFWCHRSCAPKMVVAPYRDTVEHGVFASRVPARPNPIGLSCVRLVGIEENLVRITEMDILDGTPLLDIKPFVPDYDTHVVERWGWLGKSETFDRSITTANKRFEI